MTRMIPKSGHRFSEQDHAQESMVPQTRNHNNGPPLDEDGPEWGDSDIFIYVSWRAARQRAFKPKSRDMALFRLARAEALGLTYEEYTLELLERGRYLSAADTERIDAIKRKRPL